MQSVPPSSKSPIPPEMPIPCHRPWFELENNQSDYRARYYDPATGRFLSEDPANFGGGIDFYSYVLNDPLDGTDPDGLDPNSQRCRSIRRRIENIRKNILRRQRDLDEKRDLLPGTCPGDDLKPSPSRRGHWDLISRDKAKLAALEGLYAALCNEPPKPPIPVIPVAPVPQPPLSPVPDPADPVPFRLPELPPIRYPNPGYGVPGATGAAAGMTLLTVVGMGILILALL